MPSRPLAGSGFLFRPQIMAEEDIYKPMAAIWRAPDRLIVFSEERWKGRRYYRRRVITGVSAGDVVVFDAG